MRIAKTILAMALSLLLTIAFIGCVKQDSDKQVAATINGTEILEADVTARIEFFRTDQATGEPMSDVDWATLLDKNKFTPSTLREYVIRNEFGCSILLLQRAEAKGITPNAEAIDTTLATIKSNAQSSGTTFEEYLKSIGFSSEQAYRQALEANDIKQEVAEKMIGDTKPSQTEIDTYISENAATYAGKRISIIVFATDAKDPAKSTEAVRAEAEKAHQELVGGADFAALAKKHMEGSQLADTGGDLGWGVEHYVPKEIQDALATLELDQISDVIEIVNETPASDGSDKTVKTSTFYIVKYTDDFPLTEEELKNPVDVSKVPQDVADTLTEEYVAQKKKTDQDKFFLDLAASNEIVINPMPEGLSYDVDMSLAGTGEESEPEVDWDNPFEGKTVPEPRFDENGLGISDIVEGPGVEVKKGDVVKVHYVGYLDDGKEFDNSFKRDEPYEVTVGAGGVIKGWDLGLVGMKVGGQRMLIIPPELAYGSGGYGKIPPNATLTFYLQLVSVNGDSTGYSG